MDWISALDYPEKITRLYEPELPPLDRVEIGEVSMRECGPDLHVILALSKFPKNPPLEWRKDKCNEVSLELIFRRVEEFSFTRFSVDPICDLEITKNSLVCFSARSNSIELSGKSNSVDIGRISAYIV
ncbi:Imm50 family immunity protein [Streptomyces sp. ST2-7A]|uniref:Imm50 family immunity protein n=1 Tax=Streptomyces sp. ST2-7A TaxID=2907214 RepID=UPI001F42725E|nr:Imm50 family immunity protein [Streptomyces sp. ST2-7A]MCE7083048.1 immunity 50 family protein [Streptomyces sp. ST2-7A]